MKWNVIEQFFLDANGINIEKEIKHGPFDSYNEAMKVQRGKLFQNIDNALHHVVIEIILEPGDVPPKGKLIRDGYPNDPAYGRIVTIDELAETEADRLKIRLALLRRKLQEELAELEASNYSDPQEFGDVMDVLLELRQYSNINLSQHNIDEARTKKYSRLGGFKMGKVLIPKD